MKTHFDGTHRTRTPQATWALIGGKLHRYGITRVADVTGMDDIGIPVAVATRPLARTLSTSQGKGTTWAAARVSAAMEAIEVWHAEQAVPPPSLTETPAAALDLPYEVTELDPRDGALHDQHTPLDWIPAFRLDLSDSGPIPVPRSAVKLGRHLQDRWRLHQPAASTNGLASGNSAEEAIVHALAELVERDVIGRFSGSTAQRIDPADVTDPGCSALLERLAAARVWTELWHLPNPYGLPVFSCHLWREDQPHTLVAGSGAHTSPHIALSRAITEAVQTRLTNITGGRDDISPAVYAPNAAVAAPVHTRRAEPWPAVADGFWPHFGDHATEGIYLAGQISRVTGRPPLAVTLSSPGAPFAVVKVIAPALSYRTHHTVPRPA